MITVDSDGFISLTEAGHKIADTIFERHTVLSNMLIKLGSCRDCSWRCLPYGTWSALKAFMRSKHLNSEEHIKALQQSKQIIWRNKSTFSVYWDLKSAFVFTGFDNFFYNTVLYESDMTSYPASSTAFLSSILLNSRSYGNNCFFIF